MLKMHYWKNCWLLCQRIEYNSSKRSQTKPERNSFDWQTTIGVRPLRSEQHKRIPCEQQSNPDEDFLFIVVCAFCSVAVRWFPQQSQDYQNFWRRWNWSWTVWWIIGWNIPMTMWMGENLWTTSLRMVAQGRQFSIPGTLTNYPKFCLQSVAASNVTIQHQTGT